MPMLPSAGPFRLASTSSSSSSSSLVGSTSSSPRVSLLLRLVALLGFAFLTNTLWGVVSRIASSGDSVSEAGGEYENSYEDTSSTHSTSMRRSGGGGGGSRFISFFSAPSESPTPLPSPTSTKTRSSTKTPSHTRTPSNTPTPTSTPTPSGTPTSSPSPITVDDYKKTQYQPTPFPADYESKIVIAARKMNLQPADVLKGRRDAPGDTMCPPHKLDAGAEGPANAENAASQGPFRTPSLEDVKKVTLGLLVVTHDSPSTFASSLKNWKETGLLDIVDDKVVVLSAPTPIEITMALEHGFRVYTPDPAETKLVKIRHAQWMSQWDPEPAEKFPHSRNVETDPSKPARWATYVGPAQALAYLDMRTDAVLFCEKDYQVKVSNRGLVRDLLSSVHMLNTGTAAVRLRRLDDPNREALPNCCTGECSGTFSDFATRCEWSSHLNWLSIFCDPQGVEGRSRGMLKRCLIEPPHEKEEELEPLTTYCFDMDSSQWSNNVHMTKREWWLSALGHVGVLSSPDNGNFEVNAVMLCDYTKRHGLGSGSAGNRSPNICQFAPGTFVHVELDGWNKNRLLRSVEDNEGEEKNWTDDNGNV